MPVAELEQLMTLVPPPAEPIAATGDWDAVERDLGLTLPTDYKEYIRHYGKGLLARCILAPGPFQRSKTPRRFWEDRASAYNDYAENGGVHVPYALYPACPEILPYAYFASVDHIDWLTKPDRPWDLIFYSRHAGFFNLGPRSFVTFVVQYLTGTTVMPRSVIGPPPADPKFEPGAT